MVPVCKGGFKPCSDKTKFSLNYVWSKECDVSNLHIPHTTLRDTSGCLHILGEIICPQDVDAQNLPEKEVACV